MWKIKYPIFKNWLEADLTHSEVVLLLYLAKNQDESGRCRGIYFKDVSNATGMSFQSYYNAAERLEQKKILKAYKNHSKDRDFQIMGNDLRDKNFKEGYFDLSHKIFLNPDFYKLKANEMLLAMEFMKNNMSGKRAFLIGNEALVEKYTQMFGINEVTLKGYLASLKQFFHINVRKGVYSILAKIKLVYKEFVLGQAGEEESWRNQIIAAACNRVGIKEYSAKEFSDTERLFVQYKQYGSAGMLAEKLMEAIRKSVHTINQSIARKSKWRYELHCPLVHKILRTELGIK